MKNTDFSNHFLHLGQVCVAQKAVENQANLAVIEALAKHFQVKKSAIRLISGMKSKIKIFEIV